MIQGRKPKKKRRSLSGKEFVALISLLTIALILLVVMGPRLMRARELRACQENMKGLGQAFRMYANESRGEMYPKVKLKDCNGVIQPFSGAIDPEGFFPEYFNDLDLLVCPAYTSGQTAVELWDEGKTDNPRWEEAAEFSRNGTVEPCEMLGKPYYYFGWLLGDLIFGPYERSGDPEPEDVFPENGGRMVTISPRITENYVPRLHDMRFRLATLSQIEYMRSPEFDPDATDWKLRYPSGKELNMPFGSSIPFLRNGIERFFIREIGNPAASSKAQAKIVVLHGDVKHYKLLPPVAMDHGNVLFMDGHVESVVWGRGTKTYPYTELGQILRDAANGTLEPPEGIQWQNRPIPGK